MIDVLLYRIFHFINKKLCIYLLMGNIHIHAFIIQLGGNGAAATPAVGIVV